MLSNHSSCLGFMLTVGMHEAELLSTTLSPLWSNLRFRPSNRTAASVLAVSGTTIVIVVVSGSTRGRKESV